MKLKNYAILISIWLMMSLVLSNAFKGLLLSSYVNIKSDFAVKSLQDLIDKPSVQILHDDSVEFAIKDSLEISTKLKKRIKKENKLQLIISNVKALSELKS